MKEKVSFYFTKHINELNGLAKFFGCVETAESAFGIEFAAGIEGDNPVFLSDFFECGKSNDPLFEKYDGEVVAHIFRIGKEKIIDTHSTGCRLDIMYDCDYREKGTEEFSNPKIVTRGIK